MNPRTSRLGMMIAVIMLLALGAAVFPAAAAPSYQSSVTLSDIDGLDGDVDTDFWVVDYFDTNGRGDINDPIADLATPPTHLDGYGSTALRVVPGNGAGGSGCVRLGGKVFFGTTALAGSTLSEITEFGYSFLVDQTNNANSTIYVNIFVDKNGDGAWVGADDSILVYEPIYTFGQPALDTWVDSAAIGASETGRWHVVVQPIVGIPSDTPAAPSDLWSEIIALPATGAGIDPLATTIGDLKIVNPPAGCSGSTQGGTGFEGTGSGFTLVVGQKSGGGWDDFIGFIDGVYLTVTGTNTTSRVNNLNVIGDPVTASVISGDAQSSPVNTTFAPVVVELRDANNALADIDTVVSATVPVSGASVDFGALTTEISDASGTVTFFGNANATAGAYLANVTSFSVSVDVSLTNTAAVAATTTQLFASDVNGLGGNSGAFWNIEYYDTNASADDPIGSIDRTVNSAAGGGYASFEFLVGAEEGTNGANPAGCTGAGGKTFFGTTQLAGMALRDLDQLGYSVMVESLGAGDTDGLHPYVNIFFDINNDGVWTSAFDGTLVFDTSRNNNIVWPPVLGQWYDLTDLISPTSSSSWFFATRSPLLGNIGLNQVDATVNTFQEMLNYPLKPEVIGGTRLADLKIVNPNPGCEGNAAASPSTEGTGNGLVFVFGQKNGGSYSGMDAHADSLILATSGGGAFDISPVMYDITDYGDATTITAVSGDGQSADINTAFTNPLTAAVTDALGNTVPNASVTFTVPGSGASAAVTSPVLTDLFTGQASTSATANNIIGLYAVTADLTPTLGTAASFNLTNVALAPIAPSDLTATANSGTLVDLAWTTTADGNQGDQQAVQRSPAGAGTWTTLITLSANAQAYTDSAACSDSFDYQIRVFNDTGEAFSNTASITIPTCPVDISTSAGSDQSATISTTYANPIVALVIDSDGQPVVGATVTFIAPVTGASVTFPSGNSAVTDASGLASVAVAANGTPGTAVVVAITTSVPGDAAFFTLNNTPAVPAAVSDLTSTPVSGTAINLAWTSTSTSAFDSYTVYRASDGVTFTALVTLAAGANSYADSGLVCDVLYTYRVDITNSAGTMAGNTAGATTNACGELLTNGDFNTDAGLLTKKVPTGWTGKTLGVDRQKCGADGKDLDGACYLMFKGRSGTKGRFLQNVDVSTLTAGQTLTLTASGNAAGGAKGTVELVVTYSNPLRALKPIIMKYPLKWDTNTGGYMTQSISHTLVAVPTKVSVVIRSRALKGKWFVDGVSLSLTNIGALRLPEN